MSSNKTILISDFGEIITGKTPSSNNPEDFGQEILFVTPSDDFNKKYIKTTSRSLSQEGAEKLKSKLLPPESVMVNCIGSDMGKLAMNFLPAITNQQINSIIVDKTKYDSSYVYYKLKMSYDILRQNATGSTAIPLLNKTDFSKIEINVNGNLPTQQKIAAVLSALDAKIELNQRKNAELESIAKTLYDYWFVQFNFPNKNGKPYKTNGGKMIWNEVLKRDIPQDWEVKKIGEVLKIVRGASPRPIDDYLSDEGMPWVKISDATATDNRFITKTKQFIIKEGISKSRLLPIGTLILSNSASPAIPRITKIETCVHDGWLIIDDYSHGLTKEFMLHYFEQERPRILNMGTGSIFKNLKTEYIKDLNILLPPVHVLDMITPQLKTISETIYNRTKESQTLTELRDWLLPMLMNGQVKVE